MVPTRKLAANRCNVPDQDGFGEISREGGGKKRKEKKDKKNTINSISPPSPICSSDFCNPMDEEERQIKRGYG